MFQTLLYKKLVLNFILKLCLFSMNKVGRIYLFMRIDIHIFINYMTTRIGIKMLKCLPWSSFTQFSCLTVAKCMITLLVKPNVPSSWIVKDERDFSREEILHITRVEWCMICNGLLDYITVWGVIIRKLDRRYAWQNFMEIKA